jgi:hypothetical protein
MKMNEVRQRLNEVELELRKTLNDRETTILRYEQQLRDKYTYRPPSSID